jgi:hypothetical protein
MNNQIHVHCFIFNGLSFQPFGGQKLKRFSQLESRTERGPVELSHSTQQPTDGKLMGCKFVRGQGIIKGGPGGGG